MELKNELREMQLVGNTEFLLDSIRKHIYFFFDDIEKVSSTDSHASAMYFLFDNLDKQQKTIYITSNLKRDQLGEVLGHPVLARIEKMCNVAEA
jgi:DNA replication protein DnaC